MTSNYRYKISFDDGLAAFGIVRANSIEDAKKYIQKDVGYSENISLEEIGFIECVEEGIENLKDNEELGVLTCDGC